MYQLHSLQVMGFNTIFLLLNHRIDIRFFNSQSAMTVISGRLLNRIIISIQHCCIWCLSIWDQPDFWGVRCFYLHLLSYETDHCILILMKSRLNNNNRFLKCLLLGSTKCFTSNEQCNTKPGENINLKKTTLCWSVCMYVYVRVCMCVGKGGGGAVLNITCLEKQKQKQQSKWKYPLAQFVFCYHNVQCLHTMQLILHPTMCQLI